MHSVHILAVLSSTLIVVQSSNQCVDGDKVYDDGQTVIYPKYQCTGWGAAASAWTATESICRNGVITQESHDGECFNNWICCPSGDSAGCVQTENQCDFNPDKKCYDVDGTEYENGAVIRDVRHECLGWGALETSFTITQEICVGGSITEETFGGQCNTGVCCQYGNFVGCTVPDCETQPDKTCLMYGNEYQEGQVIDILGYSCIGWGAMQSELQVSETICRDGQIVVEHRDIPCDHGWSCCQKDKSAYCAVSWQDCDNFNAMADVPAAADTETANVDIEEYKRSSSSSSSRKTCYVDGKEYEEGQVIRDVRHTCLGWGAAAKSFTITQEVCHDGKVREISFDGECDVGVCCEYGDFVGCTEPDCEAQSGKTCLFASKEYKDGDVVDILGYSCLGWGAMQSELQVSETLCRDGSLVVEHRDIPCGNGWSCCQVGTNAYCAASWTECDNFNPSAADVETEVVDIDAFHKKESCWVDDIEYEHGEVIRDVRHECESLESKSFTITQEICKKGKVKEKTFDGECDFGVCCEYGDFVGCTEPTCDAPSGKTCLFASKEYKDGDVIDILGYSCLGWGAMQSQIQVSETICRDGQIAVEHRDIPCDHGWACCQMGKSAYCAVSWTECDNFNSAETAKEREDIIKDIMEVYAIAEFVGNDNDGVSGEVSVDENGNIEVDLDVSLLDMTSCVDKEDKSLLYGIYNELNLEQYGDACIGEDMMDPFKSGIQCDELSDDKEPLYYNCRLGDLSGRFGPLSYDENGKIFVEENLSYSSSSGKTDGFCGLRLSPEAVYGKSIVFMCNDDKRTPLFCAPFIIKIYDEGRE